MAFPSSSRSTLKGLVFTVGRAPSTIQPASALILPSLLFARSISQSSTSFARSNSHIPTSSSLAIPPSPSPSLPPSPSPTTPPPRITFEPYFFSSLTTLESVKSTLLETRAFTTSSFVRSSADRAQETLVVAYLSKASKIEDDNLRNSYLQTLDYRHRPMTEVEQDRMAKAREQVLKGMYDVEDSSTMEEWEEERRERKEAKLKGLVGRERREKEVEVDKEVRKYRRRTMARREVRRELEEQEREKEKVKGDEESSNP